MVVQPRLMHPSPSSSLLPADQLITKLSSSSWEARAAPEPSLASLSSIFLQLLMLAPVLVTVAKSAYAHCPCLRLVVDTLVGTIEPSCKTATPPSKELCHTHLQHKEEDSCDAFSNTRRSDDSCCPKRRARYWKCSRRRCRRRKGSDECVLANFCNKLQLPPPLPFWRRRRRVQEDPAEEEELPPSVTETEEASDASAARSQDDEISSTTIKAESTIAIQQRTTPEDDTVRPTTAFPTRPLRSRAVHTAHLIDLVRMQQWDAFLQQPSSSSRRRQAKYRDSEGLYPLHWAVAGSPPLAVVETLLAAYPSAIRKKDKEGSFPLHFAACYTASLDVVDFLLSRHPAAVTQQDRYGRTPLYHATDKAARLSVLQLLSRDHPQVLTTPCHARRQRHAANITTTTTSAPPGGGAKDDDGGGKVSRDAAVRTPLYLVWSTVLTDHHARSTYHGKKWDKAVWMLDAAHRSHYPGEGGASSLLTAALRMDVYLPEPVISLILAAHPELLRVPDPLLQPLALAASRPSYTIARWHAVVEQLLRADPSAARIRGADGRSALHEVLRGLAVGRPEVVNLLLRAAPEAVAWRDGLTGLPPGLLAAAATTTATTTTRFSASIDNNVLPPSKRNDPFNLLTRKQHQLMDRTQASKTAPASRPMNGEEFSEEAAQLGTIYDLLRANPLQIHA